MEFIYKKKLLMFTISDLMTNSTLYDLLETKIPEIITMELIFDEIIRGEQRF